MEISMNLYLTIPTRSTRRLRRIFASAALLSFTTSMLGMADAGASGWRFEVGPAYRGNMKAEVSGSSRTQESGAQAARPARSVPGLSVGRAPAVGPNPDDITEIGVRTFDNGFVGEDALTENDGLTVNFGYFNDGQFDPVDDTLTFDRTTVVDDSVIVGSGTMLSRQVQTDRNQAFEMDGKLDGVGIAFTALHDLTTWNEFNIAFALGLRGYWGLDRTFRGSTFAQTVRETRSSYTDAFVYSDRIVDTYVFDAEGGVPPAPYESENGDPTADPVISNLPESTTRESTRSGTVERSITGSRTTTWRAENRITLDIESDLYQIALGGQISGELADGVALNLRPSLLLNVLDVDIDRHEQFVAIDAAGRTSLINAWHDRESKSEFLVGVGIEAGLTFSLNESWFLGIQGGYEFIETAKIDVGPNRVKFDLSAFTAAAVVGATF